MGISLRMRLMVPMTTTLPLTSGVWVRCRLERKRRDPDSPATRWVLPWWHGALVWRCWMTGSKRLVMNDNFWQAISVYRFQWDWIIDLNYLFSKPATPVLTLGKPMAKHPQKLRTCTTHLTSDDSSVSAFIVSLTSTSPPPPLFIYFIMIPC